MRPPHFFFLPDGSDRRRGCLAERLRRHPPAPGRRLRDGDADHRRRQHPRHRHAPGRPVRRQVLFPLRRPTPRHQGRFPQGISASLRFGPGLEGQACRRHAGVLLHHRSRPERDHRPGHANHRRLQSRGLCQFHGVSLAQLHSVHRRDRPRKRRSQARLHPAAQIQRHTERQRPRAATGHHRQHGRASPGRLLHLSRQGQGLQRIRPGHRIRGGGCRTQCAVGVRRIRTLHREDRPGDRHHPEEIRARHWRGRSAGHSRQAPRQPWHGGAEHRCGQRQAARFPAKPPGRRQGRLHHRCRCRRHWQAGERARLRSLCALGGV